jgi:hypothetical protein
MCPLGIFIESCAQLIYLTLSPCLISAMFKTAVVLLNLHASVVSQQSSWAQWGNTPVRLAGDGHDHVRMG